MSSLASADSIPFSDDLPTIDRTPGSHPIPFLVAVRSPSLRPKRLPLSDEFHFVGGAVVVELDELVEMVELVELVELDELVEVLELVELIELVVVDVVVNVEVVVVGNTS